MFSWKKDEKRVFMDKEEKGTSQKKLFFSSACCTTGIGFTPIEIQVSGGK